MKTLSVLKELVKIPSVSGFEKRTGEKISSFLPLFERDKAGNIIIGGSSKILVEAHMDEVGFLKTQNGYAKIGDIEDNNIKDIVDGRKFSYFRRRFYQDGSTVQSPGLDNKAGCTALLLAAEALAGKATIAFTVEEETTGTGIIEVVRKVRPKAVVSIDAAYAKPDGKERWEIPECGKGPAIQIQGKGFTTEWRLVEEAAKKSGIECQFEIIDSDNGTTNLSYLTENIRKIQINIPVKTSIPH